MDETKYQGMLKRTKVPLPMGKLEIKVYVGVLSSLIFGIAWSIHENNWEYFARSGSFVVVVGIYLAWRDYVNMFGDVKRIYADWYKLILREFDQSPSLGAGGFFPKMIAKQNMRKDIEMVDDRIQKLLEAMIYRVRTTEAVILGLGTLVWGFGSVLQPACVA